MKIPGGMPKLIENPRNSTSKKSKSLTKPKLNAQNQLIFLTN